MWVPTVTINKNFSAVNSKLNSATIVTNQTMNTPIVSMMDKNYTLALNNDIWEHFNVLVM